MQNSARLCCSAPSFSPARRSSTWSTAELAGHLSAVRVCLMCRQVTLYNRRSCSPAWQELHCPQLRSRQKGREQGLRAFKHTTLCRGQKGQTNLVQVCLTLPGVRNSTSITWGPACYGVQHSEEHAVNARRVPAALYVCTAESHALQVVPHLRQSLRTIPARGHQIRRQPLGHRTQDSPRGSSTAPSTSPMPSVCRLPCVST